MMEALNRGHKWSEESKANFRGKKKTPEHVAKMAKKRKGMRLSEQTCKRMSIARTGKPRPLEVTEKILATKRKNMLIKNNLN